MTLKVYASENLPQNLQETLENLKESFVVERRERLKQESGFVFRGGILNFVDAELGELDLDFTQPSFRRPHRGQNELLAKALGLGKGVKSVWDMTCGLAEDAFFISQLGFQVSAFERSSFVYLLVKEALRRMTDPPFQIFYGDSAEVLSDVIENKKERPQGIFLDPMFPEKKKSALPRKEMQIFRKWVGGDSDASKLLDLSLQTATHRVVVKRPLKAEELANNLNKRVTHSFKGSAVRYDFYSTVV